MTASENSSSGSNTAGAGGTAVLAESYPNSEALFSRATAVTPGGVNSPVRAMRSVGREHPLFIQRGAGSTVWDADNNAYTDWVMSWGALPLGHAHPEVVRAVQAAVAAGSSFGAPTSREVELAELICDALPSVERIRFVSSGTEATMSALRVARAATGRTDIVTFSGCYHGHSDPFLATGGSGLATLAIPSSPGVPETVTAATRLATYNDLASVEACFAAANGEIAAIFVEPVAANMGVVPPSPDFLTGLRAICDRTGALLVFDEVITGFRVGWSGAQGLYGVHPDLTTLGKIIGGGLPVGAFGGRADLMDLVAPSGSVYQAGTLSGNPTAMAAGIATLQLLHGGDTYTQLEQRGAELESALAAAIGRGADRCALQRVGSLLTCFFLGIELAAPPRNFGEAQQLDTDEFAQAHASALNGGHLLPASQFEALFVSTAHSPAQMQSLADAVGATLQSENLS